MNFLKGIWQGVWAFICGIGLGIWENPWTLIIIIPTIIYLFFGKKIKKWWQKIRR